MSDYLDLRENLFEVSIELDGFADGFTSDWTPGVIIESIWFGRGVLAESRGSSENLSGASDMYWSNSFGLRAL